MAAEEYLLNAFSEDVFMLWQNASAVVVGQYQNTLAEINQDFVNRNNISVVRRLTGGGAVFHDSGNLNFTFIKTGTEPNFEQFTRPIIELLRSLGVNANFEGRNDITVEGKKISGNAMLTSGNRILEHGTLLFASYMENISAALNANSLKFEDKAVKSVRSRVANISQYLSKPMTVIEFRDEIMKFMFENTPNCRNYSLTAKDVKAIEELRNSKYATWEWNYGKSPKYTFTKSFRTSAGNMEIFIDTDKGIIQKMKLFGDFFGNGIAELEAKFAGCRHDKNSIAAKISEISPQKYIVNLLPDELLNGFF
jgi:lipoate-protein ligase A